MIVRRTFEYLTGYDVPDSSLCEHFGGRINTEPKILIYETLDVMIPSAHKKRIGIAGAYCTVIHLLISPST